MTSGSKEQWLSDRFLVLTSREGMVRQMQTTAHTESNSFLPAFATWLSSLGTDSARLGEALGHSSLDRECRELFAGGLNYLFRSLDLVPDGIDDIGYLDDAFVLRVACELGLRHYDSAESDVSLPDELFGFADDCEIIREFLGEDYSRFEDYVRGLRVGTARGRDVVDIVSDSATCEAFLSDVRGFATNFEAPTFAAEERNLVKLKAFFSARLPRRRDSMLG